MTTVILAGLAWVVLALPVAVVVGRAVRTADIETDAPFGTDSIERYLADQAPAPLP